MPTTIVTKGFGPPTGGRQSGTIEIEPERWQLVSVPVQYGYWDTQTGKPKYDPNIVARVQNYLIDQIEDVYGVAANTMVEVINTYIGDEHKMWNYVPGVTIDTSEHNFELAYVDGTNVEYCGLWIKSIHPTPFDIVWG